MKYVVFSLLIAFLPFRSLHSQVQNRQNENILAVTGSAILKQIPELLSVKISVRAEASRYNSCHEKLLWTADQAISILARQGIDRKLIRTDDLSVGEKREFIQENKTRISYEGNLTLTIEHPWTKEFTGKLLSAFRNDSVTFLYNLDFMLSENQKKELREKATKDAMLDAREKAEALATAAGVKLLKINYISYREGGPGQFDDGSLVRGNVLAFSRAGRDQYKSLPDLEFNPKEIAVQRSVTVEWLIGNP